MFKCLYICIYLSIIFHDIYKSNSMLTFIMVICRRQPTTPNIRYYVTYHAYPPESPCVFYGWVPRAWNLRENKNFEYAHQILDGNNIEPPISENYNRMQIITSFA